MIISLAFLWYGLVPLAGALLRRYKWLVFRRRFDELRLRPMLDYNRYRQQEESGCDGNESAAFHFVGGFESVTDGQTLWIRNEDLTIPVSLKNAETYLLPMQKNEGPAEIFDPGEEAPEKIRWDRISALTEGARVFVGGLLACHEGRWDFVSTKKNPLMVIFHDGPDESLAGKVICAGRHRGDYWNAITPYSLVLGALCLIMIAVQFIPRPAFRMTVIVSFIALFIPLYPVIPPGLLFTVIHRRLTWRSRMLRINSDIAQTQIAAKRCKGLAYTLEILAWLVLLTGIGLNIFFLSMVLIVL